MKAGKPPAMRRTSIAPTARVHPVLHPAVVALAAETTTVVGVVPVGEAVGQAAVADDVLKANQQGSGLCGFAVRFSILGYSFANNTRFVHPA